MKDCEFFPQWYSQANLPRIQSERYKKSQLYLAEKE